MFRIKQQPNGLFTLQSFVKEITGNEKIWSAENLNADAVHKAILSRSDKELEGRDYIVLKATGYPIILTTTNTLKSTH